MTLFEELGVEYKEVDGILYPLLSVDEAEYNLTDIGKYGRMWLSYMEENEPSEYHHMARMGQLRKRAEAVNEEAYERLPVNKNGEPDYEFMANYMQSLPYSSNI